MIPELRRELARSRPNTNPSLSLPLSDLVPKIAFLRVIEAIQTAKVLGTINSVSRPKILHGVTDKIVEY